MDGIVNSIVGFKSEFRGNIVLSGDFRVDGDFIGKISSKGKIFISETGRVKGDISCPFLVIAGVFDGNAFSDYCEFKKTSVILGYINSKTLKAEEGSMLFTKFSIKDTKVLREREIKDIKNIKTIKKDDKDDNL